MTIETEFLEGKKSNLWTWIILAFVVIIGVVVASFALDNPELAERGVDAFLGLPAWAFPVAVGVLGLIIYWVGLKIEADWPELLGALMIAGSVLAGEILVGWNKFELGGIAAIPYVLPPAVFLIFLAVAVAKSR